VENDNENSQDLIKVDGYFHQVDGLNRNFLIKSFIKNRYEIIGG